MDDDTTSPDRRIYAAADALLLDRGSLDAVTLADIVGRVGGRRQNVGRVLNRWRHDREMMAASLPEAVLRAARNAARDMWLIVKLTAAPPAEARGEERTAPAESDPHPHRQAAPDRSKGAPQRSGERPASVRPPPGLVQTPPRRPGRYSSTRLGPELRQRAGFAAGHAKRKAEKEARRKAQKEAATVARKIARETPRPRTTGMRKPVPSKPRGRPPETPQDKAARMALMRAFVERERPPEPVVESDWIGARSPPVARAVATELRRAGRPLDAETLIGTGRIPLKTKRAYRSMPPLLVGSRIERGRGGYWFDYEERPGKGARAAGTEPDYQIVRIVGEILWRKALVLMGTAEHPPDHAALRAHLQPEIAYLNPEWLVQQLKRARKEGAVEASKGGFALTRPLRSID